jgi:hypothetical protein
MADLSQTRLKVSWLNFLIYILAGTGIPKYKITAGDGKEIAQRTAEFVIINSATLCAFSALLCGKKTCD